MLPLFALNRIALSRLSWADFLRTARRLEVSAIELRNDLAGVELQAGPGALEVGAMARGLGLRIRSINALQRFEQFDAQRAEQAREMIRQAQDAGAECLVLCPTNDRRDPRRAAERASDLLAALNQLAPRLRDAGLTGLIEPLGFAECALRLKSQAIEAIGQCRDPGVFALVHDTFHHRLAGEDSLFAAHTGLVHVSGVRDTTRPWAELRDGHRVLVDEHDRLGSVDQLHDLLASGYQGLVSFEPFAAEVCQAEDGADQLARSMDWIREALARRAGTA